jgi:hypothetical protein
MSRHSESLRPFGRCLPSIETPDVGCDIRGAYSRCNPARGMLNNHDTKE